MEEVKKKNCTHLLWLGLLLFALLAFLSNCVGSSNHLVMAQKAKTTAQEGLSKNGFGYALASLEGADLVVRGNAPSQEIKLASCNAALDALKEAKMVGLPGVVRSVVCKINAPGDANNSDANNKVAAKADEPPILVTKDGIKEQSKAYVQKITSCNNEVATVAKSGKIGFDKGSSNITSGKEIITKVAEIARKCGNVKIEVGGHTDSGGAAAMNMKLSQLRAEEVRNNLIKLGLKPEQVTAKGYGSTRPLVDDHAVIGVDNPQRAMNRRIEFTVSAQ